MMRLFLSICFLVMSLNVQGQTSDAWLMQRGELLQTWERSEVWANWIGNLCLPVEDIKTSLPLSNLRTAEEEKVAALDYLTGSLRKVSDTNGSLRTMLSESSNYMRSKVNKCETIFQAGLIFVMGYRMPICLISPILWVVDNA